PSPSKSQARVAMGPSGSVEVSVRTTSSSTTAGEGENVKLAVGGPVSGVDGSQSSSTPLPGTSVAPGLTAGSSSSQSMFACQPSASASGCTGTAVHRVVAARPRPSVVWATTACAWSAAAGVAVNTWLVPVPTTSGPTAHSVVSSSPSGSVGVTVNSCVPPTGTSTRPPAAGVGAPCEGGRLPVVTFV